VIKYFLFSVYFCVNGAQADGNSHTLFDRCSALLEKILHLELAGNKGEVHYPDGTLAIPIYEGKTLKDVQVIMPDGRKLIFARTNRPFYSYPIPDRLINQVKGKILDIGIGGGQAVEDLRALGKNAEGLDIFLTLKQRSKPYFHQKNMPNTDLPNESFEVVISNQSIFSYPFILTQTKLRHMKELERILEKKGLIILGNVAPKNIRDIVDAFPGLKIDDSEEPNATRYEFVVIKKIAN
jgi:SAM-dependent methyltransferase